MTLLQLKKINLWLDSINEDDQQIRNATLQNCKDDKEALEYFLERAKEVK